MPKQRKAARRKKSLAGKKPRPPSRKKRPPKRPLAVSRPVNGSERVLALDVSSKCVGWALFVDGQLEQHGRALQTGKGHGERLHRFRIWILDMCQEFQPTQLIYEAPYSGRMRNTFGILSRYAGTVELCYFEYFKAEIPPANAVPAHLVKKAIGAKKGRNHAENKKIVLLLVNQTFGLGLKYKDNDTTKRISQDDEADAIALNWAWHVLYRGEND